MSLLEARYRPHIKMAHTFWKNFLTPGDRVVDATAGNGHDLIFLAGLLQGRGLLVGYDIQLEALDACQKKINELNKTEASIVTLKHRSHCQINEKGLALVVYNLGYLPGADKSLTTQVTSTLLSLNAACSALRPGGCLSIMCYPGHPEGLKELEAILDWLETLPADWDWQHHLFRLGSPSWLLVRKPS
jgi:hypothetical protein